MIRFVKTISCPLGAEQSHSSEEDNEPPDELAA